MTISKEERQRNEESLSAVASQAARVDDTAAPSNTPPSWSGIFAEGLDWKQWPGDDWNWYATGKLPDIDDQYYEWLDEQDIDFTHPGRWAEGKNLFSRLSWADHLRNTRIAFELQKKEPLVVLDVACGIGHPIGTAINGMGLDTMYVGMDIMWYRAKAVIKEHARRPFVGLCHDIRAGIPMADSSVDVVCCLEGPEHFCTSEEDGYHLVQFFREVRRVLKPHGIMYMATPVPDGAVLMHPHCHDEEFSEEHVLAALRMAELTCWQRFNYRARPQVAKKLRMNAGDELARGQGFPPAVVDAYELPKLTYNNLVPGNALYFVGHAR